MYYRCRTTEKPVNSTYWPKSPIYTRICSKSNDFGGEYQCPKGLYCGSPLEYGIELEDDGIYKDSQVQYGIATFDNIGQAFIAVFQIFSAEDWSLLMNNVSSIYFLNPIVFLAGRWLFLFFYQDLLLHNCYHWALLHASAAPCGNQLEPDEDS